MRTILAIIGALAIFVVGVFAVLIVIGLNAVKPLTAEATAFADEAIPAIATDWNGDALVDRASKELLTEMTADQLDGVMAFGAQQLGALTNYGGASCTIVDYNFSTDEGELVQASCDARADHERGGAGYNLALVKRDDAWALLSFFVTPDEIIETDDSARTARFESETLDIFRVSVADRSIGLTTGRAVAIGADIRGFEKIENIQQPE